MKMRRVCLSALRRWTVVIWVFVKICCGMIFTEVSLFVIESVETNVDTLLKLISCDNHDGKGKIVRRMLFFWKILLKKCATNA